MTNQETAPTMPDAQLEQPVPVQGDADAAEAAKLETNPAEAPVEGAAETEQAEAAPNASAEAETAPRDADTEDKTESSAEALPEDAVEGAGEKPEVKVDTLHKELEDLYRAEEIKDPETVIDTADQLRVLDSALGEIGERIAGLQKFINEKKAGIDAKRAELGVDTQASEQEPLREEAELQELLEEQEELEANREEAESVKEMQEVMDELHKLPKADVIYIMQHGVMPSGEPVRTASGKELKPDIVRDLASAVEKGVKFITKAILKITLAAVKGVIKGIFAAFTEK